MSSSSSSIQAWNRESRSSAIAKFLLVFGPIVSVFAVFNISAGNLTVGFLEAILAITACASWRFRQRIPVRLLETVAASQIAILTYVFLYFRAVGDSAYVWAIVFPFFISYLLGIQQAVRWILGFASAAVATHLLLWTQGVELYWPYPLAPFVLFAYATVSIIAYFFGLQNEAYALKLMSMAEQLTRHADALEQSEIRYQSILQSSMHAVMIADSDRNIVEVNRAFENVTGYKKEEVVGKFPRFLKSEKHEEAFYTDLIKTLNKTGAWRGSTWNRRKNGESYPAALSLSATTNSKGKVSHYVCIFSDSSEQAALEERLRQIKTMEAIGTLTGGIAHDFNNMLAGITGNLYLARSEEDSAARFELLSNAETISWRAATMIQQLLIFSRKGSMRMTDLDLTALLRSSMEFFRSSLPDTIKISTNLGSGSLYVHGDETQLPKILLHLINNARDAVAEEKIAHISIRLDVVNPSDGDPTHNKLLTSSARYACMSVTDNGCGIATAQAPHIFEPFYTTKGPGEGTGLGLSMIYGATKTHQGFVEFESEVGSGSVFKVFLPLIETPPKREEPSVSPAAPTKANGELILIVDDEKIVLYAMVRVLRSMGYQVITARNGVEGIKKFTENREQISLVLSDVVMPQCGGAELARQIREIDSRVPVLFMTGYDRDHVLDLDTSLEGSLILSKPIDFELLRTTLRRLVKARDRQPPQSPPARPTT